MEVKLRLALPPEAMEALRDAIVKEFFAAGCPVWEDKPVQVKPDGNRPEYVNITAYTKHDSISYQEMFKLQQVFKPTNQYFGYNGINGCAITLTEVDTDKLGLKVRLA